MLETDLKSIKHILREICDSLFNSNLLLNIGREGKKMMVLHTIFNECCVVTLLHLS